MLRRRRPGTLAVLVRKEVIRRGHRGPAAHAASGRLPCATGPKAWSSRRSAPVPYEPDGAALDSRLGWCARPRDRQRRGARARVPGAARRLDRRPGLGSVADRAARRVLGFLERRWPLRSRREAWSVGAIWAALAVLFEFGFGHYVEGDSWEDLFGTYDIAAGNLWILIPLWIATGPAVIRDVAERQAAGSSQLGRQRRIR